jgi:hypothetical protein
MKSAMTISRTVTAPRLTTAIRNPMSDTRPLPKDQGGSKVMSLQSPMMAEDDAVMMKFNLCRQTQSGSGAWQVSETEMPISLCQIKTPWPQSQMEYTIQASRTALKIIETMPATSRMEICLG